MASIVLWNIKPVITLGILAYLALFLSFNYFFGRWKLKYSIEMAATDSRATAVLADTISNHASIQLFTGYSAESRNYKDVTDKQRTISRFNWNLDGVTNAIQAMLMVLVEFFLFYFAIRLWNTGTFTLGSFVLIQAYLLALGNNLWDFSRIIRDAYEGFADSKEMVQILMLDHDIVDLPKATPLRAESGEIRFENVSFGFHTNRTVVKNINLRIQAGEKIALVGPSGAGKSTLVKLLLRLYNPTEGRILIDGQDSAKVKHESLLDTLSLVPQDPLLFHRTLRENIRYGRRDATDEEVVRAGRAAHCDEFVKNLPAGYETYVGERGIKLSGGERQRVAIARALLKNAPILILDEATSSLDSHSESLIQEALNTLMKGKTTIVIAHRLSTIRKMDRVIVLDEGKIIEEGSHEKLLENDVSLYKKLWALQAGGFLQE